MTKRSKQSEKILDLPSDALADLQKFRERPNDEQGNERCPYIEKNRCVYRSAGEDGEQFLANFTVNPVEEITRDDGQEQTKAFVFTGKLQTGKPLSRVTIPARQFRSLGWITEHWGMAPTIKPGQSNEGHYRAYIQGKAAGIPSRTVYTHTGFREIGGKLHYLHAGGALGEQGGEVECELEGNLSQYRFIPTDNISPGQAARETLELFKLAPPQISFPLLGFTYLAPLCHFLEIAGITPAFSLFLVGETGSFKTVQGMLYLSHFRPYSGMSDSPPTNFHSTANAVEKMAFSLKDTILLVDDYHPTSSADKKRMDGIAQRLARGAGDHSSRGRMNADTSLKSSYSPRGLSLVTGEDAPDIGQSGLARYYFVHFEKGLVNKIKLTERQGKAHFYNANMQHFILWLIKNQDTLPDALERSFHSFVQTVNIEGSHARTGPNIAWLQMGVTMFAEYLHDIGVMDKAQANQFRDESWAVFVEAGREQTKIQAEERPVVKFLGVVDELLANGRKYVREPYSTSDARHAGDWWGYEDEEKLYLFPATVYDDVSLYLTALGGTFPVSKSRLFSDLAKNGLIETQREREKVCNTVKKRLGDGGNKRWLVIPKSSFSTVRGD